MRRYRVLLPLTVHTENGSYTQGEEFEKEFSELDEQANLQSGLLEVVASEYEVTGPHKVMDTDPGETFSASFGMVQERSLVAAGHIKPAASKPKSKVKVKADKGA